MVVLRGSEHGTGNTLRAKDLLESLGHLLKQAFPPRQGQGVRPNSAQVFYYAWQALMRQGLVSLAELDGRWLSQETVAAFQRLVPQVSVNLAADFRQAMRLRAALALAQNTGQGGVLCALLRRLLRAHPLRQTPRLGWASEHCVGIQRDVQHLWKRLWDAAWKEAEPAHLERLRRLVRPDLLPVPQIALPDVSAEAALAVLRERLEQEWNARGGAPPPPQMYLYTEPLEDFLLRELLSGEWFLRLCGVLAECARQVPGLVHARVAMLEQRYREERQRAALGGEESETSWEDEADEDEEDGGSDEAAGGLGALGLRLTPDQQRTMPLPQRYRRRMPELPTGTVTAEALCYYAITAWRIVSDGADPILITSQRLDPAVFRGLLEQAVKAAEHLLWDHTLAVRGRPQGSEQDYRLRRALLSPRLRRQYRLLSARECRWRRASGTELPPFTAWEQPLRAAMQRVVERLEASVAPAQITSERLDALLRAAPMPPEQGYVYQGSLGDWLRAALPACLPGGRELLAFCRAQAQAIGPWPSGVPGAPATAEQAALAICWNAKLALECRIDRPTQEAFAPPRTLPQRADGGLVVWLDTSLPPEALELATVLVPLITRVMYQAACDAASQGKPLLLARLQQNDLESWLWIEEAMRARARDLRLEDAENVVLEASARLREQLRRVVVPSSVTQALLAGDQSKIDSLDIYNGSKYILNKNGYHFLGSLPSFARRLVRSASKQVQPLPRRGRPARAGGHYIGMFSPAGEAVMCWALEVVVSMSQSGSRLLPSGGLDAVDGQVLARGLLASQTGRSVVIMLERRGAKVAQEIKRLWLTCSPDEPDVVRAPSPPNWLELMIALAWLLWDQRVRATPALRQAMSMLFELPVTMTGRQHALRLSPGTLERVAAWALHPRWRAEVEHTLAALGKLANKQRQAVCARLLKREGMIVLLALLESSGWQRPAWLSSLTPGQPGSAGPGGPEGPEQVTAGSVMNQEVGEALRRALVSPRAKEGSDQIAYVGRSNWLKHVGASRRARALIAEWSGLQYWGGVWKRTKQERIVCVYATVLKALPLSLRQVIVAACAVAAKERVAAMPEVLGLDGALPPQLPAQLGTPEFLLAVRDCLQTGQASAEEDDEEVEEGEERLDMLGRELHRLYRSLQVARSRICVWFQALAALPDENEGRVMLAAMSLAGGRPDQLERWLQEAALSGSECQKFCEELEKWDSRARVEAEQIPALLRSASGPLWRVWLRLRRQVGAPGVDE